METKNAKMLRRVQGKEQDYNDNPDDDFPEIIAENVPQPLTMTTSPSSQNTNNSPKSNNYLYSIFQQCQPQQQIGEEKQQPQPQPQRRDSGIIINGGVPSANGIAKSSSDLHLDRLKTSTSHLGLNAAPNEAGTPNRTKTHSDELNDTAHRIKGRGVLASMKDVNVSPAVFAEGCKLLQAAALGNSSWVQTLLKAHPENIYFRDYDRRTALHVAASEGKMDIVKLLIEKYKSPVNRSDRWGGSPLDDAHRHRHSDVVAYLREKGASTGSTDQTTNLITAAVTGDLDELRMLLEGSKKRRSLLSSSSGHPKPNKVNINAGDYDNRTALHLASAAGHDHVVAFLLQQGANPNVMDSWGGTPLDDAIRIGNVECIKLIKAKGGEVGKNKRKHLTAETPSERAKTNEDKNLNIDFSELEVIDKIGSGAFGEIFKCKWRGTLVAAKCIKSTKIVQLWREDKGQDASNDLGEAERNEALADFREETGILRTLRHPNICMLLGYSRTDNFEVMISELMKCSLLDVFTSHMLHGTSMPRKTQIIYAQQLARGMNYLHQCKPPVIHRDLKPANLLIDFSGTLKITDFGLAKVRPDPKQTETQAFRMTGETGSYRFMAPEVFRHEQYTETVDIYSFAMIFYYLVSGRPPWESFSGLDAVVKASIEADRPIINRAWDTQIASLMQRCWDENPSGRPNFSTILDELNDYSKNALKLDLDNAVANDTSASNCCVIS